MSFTVSDTTIEVEHLTLKSGKEVWGPTELDFDVEQHILSKSTSVIRDQTTEETTQSYDPPAMQYHCVHAFLRSRDSGWNLVDSAGREVPRTKSSVDNPKILSRAEKNEISEVALPLYFPEMFDRTPAVRSEDRATDEESGPLDRSNVIDMEPYPTEHNGNTTTSSEGTGSDMPRKKIQKSPAMS